MFLNAINNVIRCTRCVNILQLNNVSLKREYAGWSSRKPVTIINTDGLSEFENTSENTFPRNTRRKRRSRRMKTVKQTPDTLESSESSLATSTRKQMFTKLEENSKLVTRLMTKITSRKKRENEQEIVLEGRISIDTAMKAGFMPKALFFTDIVDIEALNLPKDHNLRLYKVPYKTLQLWSTVVHSPGLLAIFDTPNVKENAPPDNALPLTIICDQIRDPGNLGAIIRVAAGVGCEKLILMKGCIDLWNPKVVRSASGTQFSLPIYSYHVWDEIPPLIDENSNVIVTDSNFGDQHVVEYTPSMLEASMTIFDIDPESLRKSFEDIGKERRKTREFEIPTNGKTMKEFMLGLPIVPYYSLDYTKKETVVVLGGETCGLSYDSSKFLSKHKGIRVNIPLGKGIDSLNAGVALGIVAFEIKRQFLKIQNGIQ